MSDTPRTEVEVNRQKCWSDDLITIDANFACQLERELNAANQIIRQQQLLEEENLRLTAKVAQLYQGAEEQKQRIKRLEEAGDEIEMILLQYASRAELPRTMAIEQSDLSKRLCVNWRKAKEDKL